MYHMCHIAFRYMVNEPAPIYTQVQNIYTYETIATIWVMATLAFRDDRR